MILYTVGMGESGQKPDLLQDVLPLLQRLLPPVGHLLDGHHLVSHILPGVVHGAEGPVANLPEIIKDLVRVLSLEQLGDLGVLEGPGPGSGGHGVGEVLTECSVLSPAGHGSCSGNLCSEKPFSHSFSPITFRLQLLAHYRKLSRQNLKS